MPLLEYIPFFAFLKMGSIRIKNGALFSLFLCQSSGHYTMFGTKFEMLPGLDEPTWIAIAMYCILILNIRTYL